MIYDKKEIILRNISRLEKEQTELFERVLAHLGELASFLGDEAGEEEIFFRDPSFVQTYSRIMGNIKSVVADAGIKGNAERMEPIGQILSATERALVCRRLTDSLGITGVQAASTYFEDFFGNGDETISYVKNSYADEAYSRFSKALETPKVVYGYDFSEVCENVYYERSAFCILPIENTLDGRLAGFRRLVMKYGLKAVMITRVETSSEGEATVFALLKKNISIPSCDGNKFFELRVTTTDALTTLINAADVCMMKPVSITSIPDEDFTYDIVFSVSEEGICGFLSFLFLEYTDFIPTGFFGEL